MAAMMPRAKERPDFILNQEPFSPQQDQSSAGVELRLRPKLARERRCGHWLAFRKSAASIAPTGFGRHLHRRTLSRTGLLPPFVPWPEKGRSMLFTRANLGVPRTISTLEPWIWKSAWSRLPTRPPPSPSPCRPLRPGRRWLRRASTRIGQSLKHDRAIAEFQEREPPSARPWGLPTWPRRPPSIAARQANCDDAIYPPQAKRSQSRSP